MLMAFLLKSHTLLFIIVTSILLCSTTLASTNYYPSQFLKLPLLHKKPPTPSAALSADKHRLNKLPLKSAASSGSGQYLVSLHLGTPPQPLLLVVDTGSDLTWVSCSACRRRCSPSRATFFPRLSATFSPHHCFDNTCSLISHPNNNHVHCNHTRQHSTCRYEYSYSDGTLTNGFFSHETLSFLNSSTKFHRLSFGCGFWNSGPTAINGVLGLGRGPISFSSQLGRQFGHKFSYCLLDYTLSPPPTSYLILGGGVKTSKMSYTPLLTNPLSPTFYYIGIESAFINDVKLRISPSVWAIDELGNGGTVVDSGTTLTFLPLPAYRRILAVLKRLVKKIPKSTQPTLGFDLCLNTSDLSMSKQSLPKLSFELGGGSIFSPPVNNYFIDTAEDIKCLALQAVTSASSGFSVIGNLMQQGYRFEFDKDRHRLGFSRHGCAVP